MTKQYLYSWCAATDAHRSMFLLLSIQYTRGEPNQSCSVSSINERRTIRAAYSIQYTLGAQSELLSIQYTRSAVTELPHTVYTRGTLSELLSIQYTWSTVTELLNTQYTREAHNQSCWKDLTSLILHIFIAYHYCILLLQLLKYVCRYNRYKHTTQCNMRIRFLVCSAAT